MSSFALFIGAGHRLLLRAARPALGLFLAVAMTSAVLADVQGPAVGEDFFNVNGVNGNITVNEGSFVANDLRLRVVGETDASGFAGTTTHRFNGNTIGFTRTGPSGAASASPSAPGGGITQDFNSSFYYGQDGAHVVSYGQTVSLHTTENSSFGLGTNHIDWISTNVAPITRNVTVLNVAPTIANATINGTNGNVTVNEGTSLSLAMSATDPGDDVLTFGIDGPLGNAGTINQAGGTTRNSLVVNRSADDEGVISFSYQVNDDDTATSTTRSVTILNVAPTLLSVLPGNITIDASDPFAFSATASDPGVLDVLSFAWDFDFDGIFTTDFTGDNGIVPGSFYAGNGVYNARVIVDDGDGGQDFQDFTVTVVPEPTAVFLALLGAGILWAWRRRRRR